MTPRHLLEPARLAGGALLRAQSDARLVDMTRAGNDRAFEAIVRRYRSELLRYCSRILADGRADDAVQQTFVNAYGALHRDTTPLALRGWLFGIAHNVSLNILRQRGSDHAPFEAHPGAHEPADVTHERREQFRTVLAAVAALPPGQRDALLLRELEGRGHDEIAKELGVTGGAARQLISRARDRVRRAAAAILPFPLLMRLTAGSAPSPTAERLAELTAVGGGVTVSKVVATAAVGGTLIGGAVTGPDLVDGDREPRRPGVAEAATPRDGERAAAADERRVQLDDRDHSADRSGADRSGPGAGGNRDGEDRDSSGPGSMDDRDGHDRDSSGSGDDDEFDDHSGPGSSDHEDGEDFDDHSGPGPSGHEDGEDLDDSGPESGDDLDDSSGPGSGDEDPIDTLEPNDDTFDSDDSETDNSGPGGGES